MAQVNKWQGINNVDHREYGRLLNHMRANPDEPKRDTIKYINRLYRSGNDKSAIIYNKAKKLLQKEQ